MLLQQYPELIYSISCTTRAPRGDEEDGIDYHFLTVERFREEIRMGRSVKAASITGVRHAIQTSIDADLVSLVSALTLFFLAAASSFLIRCFEDI